MKLSGLCINNDYMKELYDFYLLDCAIDDLKYGENQFHWPDLSLNKLNIESTVIEVCRKWKQNFDSSYKK